MSRSQRSSAGSGTLSDSGFGLKDDEPAIGAEWICRRDTSPEEEDYHVSPLRVGPGESPLPSGPVPSQTS